MMGLVQDQVWIGSQDSVIYIIDTHSMSCNKQLTEHRHDVTGFTVDTKDQHNGCGYDRPQLTVSFQQPCKGQCKSVNEPHAALF